MTYIISHHPLIKKRHNTYFNVEKLRSSALPSTQEEEANWVWGLVEVPYTVHFLFKTIMKIWIKPCSILMGDSLGQKLSNTSSALMFTIILSAIATMQSLANEKVQSINVKLCILLRWLNQYLSSYVFFCNISWPFSSINRESLFLYSLELKQALWFWVH